MNLTERLKRGLDHTRGFTDRILAEIDAPEDWVRRPVPGSNHALWIAGHLSVATNHFVGLIDPTGRLPLDDWSRLFGKGTVPMDEFDAYPSPDELRACLTERGEAMSGMLDRYDDHDLEREISGGPPFMYDVGAVFQMSVWHEALHAGQLTVIHRMVGHQPFTQR